MKYISRIVAFALIAVMSLSFTGCSKKETTFDFSKVAEVRLYNENDADLREFIKKDEAQKVIKPISGITWKKKEKSSDTSTNYTYRIQCYTIKGEKSKNIKIVDKDSIIYNGNYWKAEEGELDLTFYKEYFAK